MRHYQKSINEIISYNQRIRDEISDTTPVKKYWNFFPTPKSLIEKMFEDYKGKPLPRNILEPSAGKGDIIDYINHRYSNDNQQNQIPNVYCYELVPELQNILRQKRCKLLGNDFLNDKPKVDFDLIIMNPPFDRGVNHILHAWDILSRGGRVIALLNKHTYYNAYTSHRLKFKTLVDEFGKIEDLGKAFESGAERTARVDVIMVTLTKKPNSYYQDLGINLNQYSNEDIRNQRAKYVVRELPIN